MHIGDQHIISDAVWTIASEVLRVDTSEFFIVLLFFSVVAIRSITRGGERLKRITDRTLEDDTIKRVRAIRRIHCHRPKPSSETSNDGFQRVKNELKADFAAQRFDRVVEVWPKISRQSVSAELFHSVVLSYAKAKKDLLVDMAVQHISQVFPKACPITVGEFINDLLEALVCMNVNTGSLRADTEKRTMRCDLAYFVHVFGQLFARTGALKNGRSYEVLFYAIGHDGQAKDLCRIIEALSRLEADAPALLTVNCFAYGACAALRFSNIDLAKKLLDRAGERMLLSQSMIFSLIDAACEGGNENAPKLVEDFTFGYLLVKRSDLIESESASFILQYASQTDNLALLERMHKWVLEHSIDLTYGGHNALLNCYTKLVGYEKSKLAVDNMMTAGFKISEGTCSRVLIICSETKNVKVAELVFRYFRQTSSSLCLRVYSTMMKVYGSVGSFGKVCELYDLVKEHNVEPDSTMYGCLIKFAVESGQFEFARKFFALSQYPDIQDYMSLIRACSKERNIAEAFSILHRLRTSPICEGKPMKDVVAILRPAYNAVLHVVVTCGEMKNARKLIEYMHNMDKEMVNSITYNTYLKGFCAQHDRQGAQEVLAEMRRNGIRPDRVTYNSLLNAAVSMQQTDEAWRIVDVMEENGVTVDNYTVTIVLKTMKTPPGSRNGVKCRVPCEQQKWNARALKLLDSVDTSDDEFLLKAALDICIRLRHISRLDTLLKQYEAGSMRPAVTTYGSLMKAYGIVRRVDRCRELWREMTQSRGLDPDAITFGCMIDALVTNNDVDGAVKLFEELDSVIFNDPVIFSTLLKGFAIDRRLEDALKLLETMKACNMDCNEVAYNTVIDACCRSGDMTKTEELLHEMIGKGLVPDIITFGTIIKGYMTVGEVDAALETYFRNFKRNLNAPIALVPNEVIFNTLLDGCIKNHCMHRCHSLLDDMISAGIKPSHITLTIVIKMYGRMLDVDRATSVLAEWSAKYDLKPNNQVFTCLISACISNHCIDKAMTILHNMQENGVSPDERTFGTLLAGLCKERRVDAAKKIVYQAFGINGSNDCLISDGRAPGVECQQLVRFLDLISPEEAETILNAIKKTESGASIAHRLVHHVANCTEGKMKMDPNWNRRRPRENNYSNSAPLQRFRNHRVPNGCHVQPDVVSKKAKKACQSKHSCARAHTKSAPAVEIHRVFLAQHLDYPSPHSKQWSAPRQLPYPKAPCQNEPWKEHPFTECSPHRPLVRQSKWPLSKCSGWMDKWATLPIDGPRIMCRQRSSVRGG